MVMLSIPTQTVSAGAVRVSGTLDPDDKVWLEGDEQPTSPGITVAGRVSAAGAGRFYFSGTFAGHATQECRRCLCEVDVAITSDVHVLFADGDHSDADDPDVYPLAQGRNGPEVDLRPAIREEWVLEIPAFVLCTPDCKGLCPTCGANLNLGACDCARQTE